MKERQKKVNVSVSLNRDLVKMVDDRVTNRSNYIDRIILEYFGQILKEDVSKIKL